MWEKKTFYLIPKSFHHSFYLLDFTRSKKFRFNYITTECCAQSVFLFCIAKKPYCRWYIKTGLIIPCSGNLSAWYKCFISLYRLIIRGDAECLQVYIVSFRQWPFAGDSTMDTDLKQCFESFLMGIFSPPSKTFLKLVIMNLVNLGKYPIYYFHVGKIEPTSITSISCGPTIEII